ncbi:hypothetical protein H4219_000103 [Mycoemilia scoparia]|uniref:Chitin-binding type-4 domain-containing protein n=1 Tax=Mycoemilia scoparia TaxID=417184 RepID=A0A9W8DXQ7_9FUNG|nr:hypothetical protein H4219_000103 [Mycoemilia scoparia]
MFFKTSAFVSTIAAMASAHMSMLSPCPRYSDGQGCPAVPGGQTVDTNIRAPIATHDSIDQPICKHETPYATPVATWKAGETVTVNFSPNGAAHGGGHCQFGLSYDGGKTFVVIHDELKYCFTGGSSSGNGVQVSSYQIPLPKDLPSGDKVVFAWAWNNAIGNREFYMNCADIKVQGGGSSFSGPKMIYPNYGPSNPLIPEFNGNYETGLDLFKSRPQITVTGSGSSPAAGNSTGPSYSAAAPSSPGGSPSGSPPAPGYSAAPPSPAGGGAPAPAYSAAPPSPAGGNSPGPAYSAAAPQGGNSPPATPEPIPRAAGNQDSSPDAGTSCSLPSPPTPPSGGSAPPVQDQQQQQQVPHGAAPNYSAAAPQQASVPGGSDSCKPGAMRCASSGTAYQVCLNGSWTDIACGPSTTCRFTNIPQCLPASFPAA